MAAGETATRDFAIADLRAYPHWLASLALWHHRQWLSGRPEAAAAQRAALDLGRREASLREHLLGDNLPLTLIAHNGSQVLASVSLVYYRFSKAQQASEWLTNLYVLPNWRRRGIATALLAAAENRARGAGLAQLLLYTSDRRDFYLARGWRPLRSGRVQGQVVDILRREFERGDPDGRPLV